MSIVIYTTDKCHNCHAAKEYFKEKGYEYEEKDARQHIQYIRDMTGKTQVPLIMVNGKPMLGWDTSTFDKLYA